MTRLAGVILSQNTRARRRRLASGGRGQGRTGPPHADGGSVDVTLVAA